MLRRTNKPGRAVYAAALLVGLFSLQPHASADRKTVPDDTQSSDEPRDIVSVRHTHGPNERIVRHEVLFEGDPRPVTSGRVQLFFEFRNGDGEAVPRELRFAKNPGGGLYGVFVTPRGHVTGYSRAWIELEARTLFVEFSARTLGNLKNDRYRWHVWSTLGVGEFENPCQAEDTGPPVCKDRAPASGWIVHRL